MSFNEVPPSSDKVKLSNIRVCVRIRPIISTDVQSPVQTTVQKRSTDSPTRRSSLPDSLSMTEDSTSVISRLTSQASVTGSPSVAWKIQHDQATLIPANNTLSSSYTVDAAFGPSSTTQDVYDSCVKDLVRSAVLEGYHASILAYGQTNSGKTFTMLGNTPSTKQRGKNPSSPISTVSASSDGIIQLAVQHVFRCIHEKSFREGGSFDPREYLLRVTFIEIYNESIHDLLAPSSSSSSIPATPQNLNNSGIRIFDSKTEGVIIRGLHEEIATTPEQVLELLHRGQKHRQVAATGLNSNSSRSHTIFRLVIESSSADRNNGLKPNSIRISSLSLVDLAGSECAKQAISLPIAQTMSAGVRQREGQYINKSLLTLGQVIYKLSEINTRPGGGTGWDDGSIQASNSVNNAHIPYRDSKLTRILQPSLSGNAQVCIICLISPLFKNLEESHNTLKFACRAKRIRQYATVNEVIDDKSLPTLLQNYRDEINALKEQLRQAKEAQQLMQGQQNQSRHSPSNGIIERAFPKRHDVDGKAETDFNDLQDSETVEDDDVQVLVQAIHNLEDLIIKTSSNQQNNSRDGSPGRQVILDGMESVISSLNNDNYDPPKRVTPPNSGDEEINPTFSACIDNENDSFDSTMVLTEINARSSYLTTSNEHFLKGTFDTHDSVRPSIQKMRSHDDESLSSRDEDNSTMHSNLIDELHRIQELLGSILRRKEMNSSSSKPSVRSTAQIMSPEKGSSSSTLYRDEEVSRLRSQLEEHALAGSLRKADVSFLEFQLQQKDALLTDISGILESVEARQMQLEKENFRLKRELGKAKEALKEKKWDMVDIKNDMMSEL